MGSKQIIDVAFQLSAVVGHVKVLAAGHGPGR